MAGEDVRAKPPDPTLSAGESGDGACSAGAALDEEAMGPETAAGATVLVRAVTDGVDATSPPGADPADRSRSPRK